jgi:two-component system phosphate regulon sensor histidine kinase PhoR
VSATEPMMATQQMDRPPLFSRPSVLVIDDEKRIRDVCIKMLTSEGFEADGGESAEVGMQKIKDKHFDIILLDLMMPGLSGLDALAQIRSLHPDTVVVVITGYATVEHSVEAMKNGAFDFIAKPFSPGDLRIVVTKAVTHINTLQDIASEKSRMRLMINQLKDGVMTTDNQKHIVQVNPSFLKLIGYCERRPIGRSVSEIVGNGTMLAMIDHVLAAPGKGYVEASEELCLDADVGDKKIIVSARCLPFKDRLRRNIGTITVLHDITAQKEMDQVKSNFVSMVSHEIRSPMNSVLMQLKVIKDGLAGETTPKQKEILERASEKITALTALVSELLDLAAMESGLRTPENEEVGIIELLEEQVAFHQPRAQAKSIRLSLKVSTIAPVLMANRFNLDEVFSNLIGNAINYTSEGGEITLSVEVEGDYCVVKIADTGIGISEEDLPRIFDRFYRVKNEQTRHIIGTGLGLPIVKSIIDAHNGLIRVDSKLNSGTTFSVLLPSFAH